MTGRSVRSPLSPLRVTWLAGGGTSNLVGGKEGHPSTTIIASSSRAR